MFLLLFTYMVLEKINHLLGLLYWLSTPLCWVAQSHRQLGFASPSMRLINPTYSRRQSVTNLISNNIILKAMSRTKNSFHRTLRLQLVPWLYFDNSLSRISHVLLFKSRGQFINLGNELFKSRKQVAVQ